MLELLSRSTLTGLLLQVDESECLFSSSDNLSIDVSSLFEQAEEIWLLVSKTLVRLGASKSCCPTSFVLHFLVEFKLARDEDVEPVIGVRALIVERLFCWYCCCCARFGAAR